MIDYFKKFPDNIENIGISLSGGTDSALILYMLVQMIIERDQVGLVHIYPIHGYDTVRTQTYSWEAAEAIVEYINRPDIIKPVYVFAYEKTEKLSKEYYWKANHEYMMRRYNIPFIIRGVTQGMPDDDRPLAKGDADSKRLHHIAKTTWILPFGSVDKKYIAEQYRKLDLDDMYKLTVSCIEDTPDPCKKCWWCKEKHWAFGSYDQYK